MVIIVVSFHLVFKCVIREIIHLTTAYHAFHEHVGMVIIVYMVSHSENVNIHIYEVMLEAWVRLETSFSIITLVNVYVELVVFTCIAGTS